MALLQNQPREEILEWIRSFHAMNDSLSTAGFHKFYSKNATVITTSGDKVEGLENLIKFFSPSFGLLSSMKHNFLPQEIDIIGNKIYMPCNITYVVKNDPTHQAFAVPAFGLFTLTDKGQEESGREEGEGIIENFQIWFDASSVWKRMAEVAATQGVKELIPAV